MRPRDLLFVAWIGGGAAVYACDEEATAARTDAAGPDSARDSVRDPPHGAEIRFARPSFHGRQDPRDAGAERRDAGAAIDPVVARGEYLVRHVGGCMDCHTPRLLSGRFDESRLLSGVEGLFDVEPDDPARGLLHSKNLTPHAKTGLGRFSDAQIKKAFQQGIDDESTVLHWMMPYWIFRNMSAADADAVVAYLRSIPAVVHDVPESQPNAVDLSKPYAPYVLPLGAVPDTLLAEDDPDHASARRGRYIATALSPCLLCHTPEQAGDAALPIDLARSFSGRRTFVPAPLGVPIDETLTRVPLIESQNLTPHENGLGTWTAEQIASALTSGIGKSLPVCDPMPSATTGDSFRGMTPDDALDLGRFFKSIAPQDSGVIPACCNACHGTGDDAGVTD